MLNLSLPVTVGYNSVALYSKLNQLFEHKRAMRNGDIHINNCTAWNKCSFTSTSRNTNWCSALREIEIDTLL